MSNGTPSMLALLGLLAVAGYQNREKLGQLLGQATGGNAGTSPGQSASGPLGGILGNIGGLLGGGSAGSVLSGGLGDLVNHFGENGQGGAASSWVKDGPNAPIDPTSLQSAIGPDVLAKLQQQTGLSREELLARLSRDLPKAVDAMTPEGRLPSIAEATQLVQPGSGPAT